MKIVIQVIINILIITCSNTFVFANIPEAERQALTDLYNSTDGDNWINNSGWLGEAGTECDWYGISCKILNTNTHVTEIDIRHNKISILPPEIGNFPELTNLQLSDNELKDLPSEIGNLTNLTSLSLSDNDLTSLPSEVGKLYKLEILYLPDNDLTVLPTEIGNLTNLEQLSIFSNKLISLPSEIGNLVSLKRLHLSENDLTNLPSGIGNLINLTEISARSNNLISIPPEIGNLSKLRWLDLRWNNITSVPSEIGNLISLTTLHLYDNNLKNVPSTIGNLTSLTDLFLSKNELTSVPAEIVNLVNLSELYLRENYLKTVPQGIVNLVNLNELYLDKNCLTIVPSEIGNLGNLETLSLSGNQLSSLPAEIVKLKKLNKAFFSANALEISNPEIIQFLNSMQSNWKSTQTVCPTQLTVTTKTSNSITLSWLSINYELDKGGYEICYSDSSTELYTLCETTDSKEIEQIILTGLYPNTTYSIKARSFTNPHTSGIWYYNNPNTIYSQFTDEIIVKTLSVSIPVTERQALIDFYDSTGGDNWLNKTGWKGKIGTECSWFGVECDSNKTHVLKLNFWNSGDGNNLIGAINQTIENLIHLKEIGLNNNHINQLPPGTGNLTHLTYLNMRHNDLKSIPSEIGNLTHLTFLNLAYNELTSLPPEIGNLTHLSELYLYHNELTSLPPQIGNLVNLTELYLSFNSLRDVQPEIGNLNNLTSLDLGYNELKSLPPEIGNLSNLRSLDLPKNELTNVPPEIGNLTSLRSLYLSFNHLESVPLELGNLSNLSNIYLNGNKLSSLPFEITYLKNNVFYNFYFDENALEISDPEIINFLDSNRDKWEKTQTVSPKQLTVTTITSNSITLSWSVIEFDIYQGGYEVFYSQGSNESYTIYGMTSNKSIEQMTISGLKSNKTYYFKVRSVTYPYSSQTWNNNNPNTVKSRFTSEITAKTLYLKPTNPKITSIFPDKGDQAGGETIVISGSDFTEDVNVSFGGIHSQIISSTSSSIICIAPSHEPGAVTIVVTNIDDQTTRYSKKYIYIMEPTYSKGSPIPDSGQSKCYDNENKIPCPNQGENFYGQDASYDINPKTYTKMDKNGHELPYTATSWVMVKDNVTGLVWEVKTAPDGHKNYNDPNDADNTYCWYNSNKDTNGGDTGCSDSENTELYIYDLNNTSFGGFSDWRLPTVKELASIANLSKYDPAITELFFPNNMSYEYYFMGYGYWSSTIHASNQKLAWCVLFDDGNGHYSYKTQEWFARAVRSGQSRSFDSLVINEDETVTDINTGLMWQKNSLYQMSWEEALIKCSHLKIDVYSDWRLPNREELRSIANFQKYDPSISDSLISNTMSSGYWSSTTDAINQSKAWYINFIYGYSYANFNKTSELFVRAVRSGQSILLGNLLIRSPSQASFLVIGNIIQIRWNTAEINDHVKISISRQGGKEETFSTIAETENDGEYIWQVTSPKSYNCVLKITPINDPSKGTSQGLFSILDKPIISPNPENNANHVHINPLSWTYNGVTPADKDKELIYNIYLGKKNPPPLLIKGYTSTVYIPDNLEINTTYYWQINTQDRYHNLSVGPIWKFEAISDPFKPEITFFQVKNNSTKNSFITNNRNVSVELRLTVNTDSIKRWLIKEIHEPPTLEEMMNSSPKMITQYTLESPEDGKKCLYAWVMDSFDNISIVKECSIILDTKPPEIIDLVDDLTPVINKTWKLETDENNCLFKYSINRSEISQIQGEYDYYTSAVKGNTTGRWYIHVRAKDPAGNESNIARAFAEFKIPNVQFKTAYSEGDEQKNQVMIELDLSHAIDVDVLVNYKLLYNSTINQYAVKYLDFNLPDEPDAIIKAGKSKGYIRIIVIDDSFNEKKEGIVIELTGANVDLGFELIHKYMIIDDDSILPDVIIPEGLRIFEDNTNQLELTWYYMGNNLTYNVYKSLLPNGFFIKCDPYELTEPKFVDTDVSQGTRYWYKVTTINALGEESLFSNTVSAQIDSQEGGGYQLLAPQPYQMQLSGLKATYQIMIIPQGGYAGFIDLSVADLPSLVKASFNHNPIKLPGFETLTVNVANIVEPDQYKFLVSAIGANCIETIALYLDVKELSHKESAISAYTKRSQIYLHESIDIYGNIIPKGINTSVAIHIQHESDEYPTIINTKTDENKSYLSTYIPEKTGRYVIFSQWDGDTYFDSAESTHLSLTVLRGKSKLTCRTPDEDISSDKMVHINGQLQMPSIGDAHIVLLKKYIINNSDYELEHIENKIFTGSDGSYSYSIKLEREGLWEITACWEGNETYSGGISETLRLYPGLKAGKALIVAGGGILSSNKLWETTQYLTTNFYKLLLNRRYPKDLIHYISPDTGHNDTQIVINDDIPTVSDIEQYIESLYIDTSQQNVNSERPFILYLADHGGDQTFKVNHGLEILNASDLDDWLDDLQTHTGCSVYIIIEACFSGTFVDILAPTDAQNRVIITSAGNHVAIYDKDGRVSFSQILFNELNAGSSLYQSFHYAKEQLLNQSLFYGQFPQIYDGQDGKLAQKSYISGSFNIGDILPEIVDHTTSQSLTAGAHELFAVVVDVEGVKQVWASIIPPNFQLPETTGEFDTPIINIPAIPLLDQGNGRYQGRFENFHHRGIYHVSFFCEDLAGNVVTKEILLNVLDGIIPGDLDNSGSISLCDAIISLQNIAGMDVNIDTSTRILCNGVIGPCEVIEILQEMVK